MVARYAVGDPSSDSMRRAAARSSTARRPPPPRVGPHASSEHLARLDVFCDIGIAPADGVRYRASRASTDEERQFGRRPISRHASGSGVVVAAPRFAAPRRDVRRLNHMKGAPRRPRASNGDALEGSARARPIARPTRAPELEGPRNSNISVGRARTHTTFGCLARFGALRAQSP